MILRFSGDLLVMLILFWSNGPIWKLAVLPVSSDMLPTQLQTNFNTNKMSVEVVDLQFRRS
jgi:hypothetical protein